MSALGSLVGDANPCVLHLLEPGDALLVPEAASGRTAIAFETSDQGLMISTIEGRIRVVSPRSKDWQPLNAGETFQASKGRASRSEEWLQSSELCNDSDLLGEASANAPSVQGTRDAAETEFQWLASVQCRGVGRQR